MLTEGGVPLPDAYAHQREHIARTRERSNASFKGRAGALNPPHYIQDQAD
jgi:hypothetical protein